MNSINAQIGKRISIRHQMMEIIGIRARGRRQYLLVRDDNGAEILVPPRALLRARVAQSTE